MRAGRGGGDGWRDKFSPEGFRSKTVLGDGLRI